RDPLGRRVHLQRQGHLRTHGYLRGQAQANGPAAGAPAGLEEGGGEAGAGSQDRARGGSVAPWPFASSSPPPPRVAISRTSLTPRSQSTSRRNASSGPRDASTAGTTRAASPCVIAGAG